jgi:hypothetical protein
LVAGGAPRARVGTFIVGGYTDSAAPVGRGADGVDAMA